MKKFLFFTSMKQVAIASTVAVLSVGCIGTGIYVATNNNVETVAETTSKKDNTSDKKNIANKEDTSRKETSVKKATKTTEKTTTEKSKKVDKKTTEKKTASVTAKKETKADTPKAEEPNVEEPKVETPQAEEESPLAKGEREREEQRIQEGIALGYEDCPSCGAKASVFNGGWHYFNNVNTIDGGVWDPNYPAYYCFEGHQCIKCNYAEERGFREITEEEYYSSH